MSFVAFMSSTHLHKSFHRIVLFLYEMAMCTRWWWVFHVPQMALLMAIENRKQLQNVICGNQMEHKTHYCIEWNEVSFVFDSTAIQFGMMSLFHHRKKTSLHYPTRIEQPNSAHKSMMMTDENRLRSYKWPCLQVWNISLFIRNSKIIL